MLPSHGRFDYSAIIDRPTYEWPGGKRLAVYVALNIEHFAFGEGLGPNLGVESPPPNHRSWAWREYGNRVGVWRLFDLFEELDMPAAQLINTELYDHAPRIMEKIAERGDEIVGHGRTNSERQVDMSEEEERTMLQSCADIIAKNSGQRPKGWLGPWLSQTRLTPDLLKETGYSYMLDWAHDDQPNWCATRSGALLSVPYPNEANDSFAIVNRRSSIDEFAAMITRGFDEMLRQSEKQPLVFTVSLHTFVVGQPFRLAYLRDALKHVMAHRDDIWLTTPGRIAEHCAALPAKALPRPAG